MPKVLNFVYCDNAKIVPTQAGERQEIFGVLSVLRPVALPGNYSFCIVCDITDIEPSRSNFLQFVFEGPEGEKAYDTGKIEVHAAPEVDNKKPAVLKFNLELRNIILRSEGEYKTIVCCNNMEIGKYAIKVEKMEII